MKKVDVTVVIAMYNAANTIRRTFDSILKQTILPNEIIIVNDGSLDKSEEIAYEIQNEFPTLMYIPLQNNHGAAYAKSYGAKKATSTYVLFLDADDELEENALEKVKEAIDLKPDYICSSFVSHIFNDKTVIEKAYYCKNPYPYLMKFPFHYLGLPPSVFKTEYFINLGGFVGDLRWGDGLAFIRNYVKNYGNVYFLQDSIYLYYHNTFNISKKNRNFSNYLSLFQQIYKENKEYLDNHPKDQITWLLFLMLCDWKVNKQTVYMRKCINICIHHPISGIISLFYTIGKVGIKLVKKTKF